ncbi:MAG: hypothetical protein ACM3MN_08940, partial [Nitrospirota bacterium]
MDWGLLHHMLKGLALLGAFLFLSATLIAVWRARGIFGWNRSLRHEFRGLEQSGLREHLRAAKKRLSSLSNAAGRSGAPISQSFPSWQICRTMCAPSLAPTIRRESGPNSGSPPGASSEPPGSRSIAW